MTANERASRRLLTPDEVAAELGISTKTLSNWRGLRQGPRWLKIGGRVRYPADGIAEYLEAAERAASTWRGPAAS